MSNSILPSGEVMKVTPAEVLRYVNPDVLRQIFRQERLRWNLKPNKDADYESNSTLYKYTGEIHNEVRYQRMEIRTFPDNDAYPGYTGFNNDSGEFGLVHNVGDWNHGISTESLKEIINRTQIGSIAKVPGKKGYGRSDNGEMVTDTDNRMAMILFDPYDGRGYLYSNDDPNYTNNLNRNPETKLPLRTLARIGDIPTKMTDLHNDLDFVSDPDFHHTSNDFTDSNRYILDNIDDRTFVYPAISKDSSGNYIKNYRVNLRGLNSYGEGDGDNPYNSQPDIGELEGNGDRKGDGINSYNEGKNFSGVNNPTGYFSGIFRSVEELESVDLVGQLKTPLTNGDTPGEKRPYNYYIFDGVWSPTWFDRVMYKDSYLAQSLNPNDMESAFEDREPHPLKSVPQIGDQYLTTKLYQWRYNRVTINYHAKDIVISIINPGEEYKAGDILRWTFGDDVLLYLVTVVGPNGQIQVGEYVQPLEDKKIFLQNPSTHGIGIPFANSTSVGRGATLSVDCKATILTNATQIKNNLYAYVDVVPTVRSDNGTDWSDTQAPDTQGGLINIRSTAPSPGYTGVNSGRGGPGPNNSSAKTRYHEHGGNATAGSQVHLFRYIINTESPTWIVKDGIQVFTGKWVDQGPMSVERPADIKALFLSNSDTNNFNNYYKFTLDILLDNIRQTPDAVVSNNQNALAQPYIHMAQRDPKPDQRFTIESIDPNSSKIIEVDITDRVIYINGASGVVFLYNSIHKNDPNFGYGNRPVGWFSIVGGMAR